MEYTKDMILHVNYGQEVKKERKILKLLNKVGKALSKHKMMTTIVSITVMLMALDFMLVASFMQVLTTI